MTTSAVFTSVSLLFEAGIVPMTTSVVVAVQFPYYLRRALSP